MDGGMPLAACWENLSPLTYQSVSQSKVQQSVRELVEARGV